MDVEALLGIPNIKKLMEESEYKVAFEKSVFANKGALVLEEFLDVRPTVAAALKDIITEGGLREGDKLITSKIGPIIICANKSPDEVSVDNSTAAFYKERFPYSCNVAWNNYNTSNYTRLLELTFPDEVENNFSWINLIAEVCSYTSTTKPVSPRIAIEAMKLILTTKDIQSLYAIQELNMSRITEIKESIRRKELNNYLIDYVKKLREKIETANISTTRGLWGIAYWVEEIINLLQSIPETSEKLLAEVSKTINSCKLKLEEIAAEEAALKTKYSTSQIVIKELYEKIQEYTIS
jgi:hypothetical protein